MLPEMLLQQMAIGGVMVIPIGPSGRQTLQRVTRIGDTYKIENFDAVTFVPFLAGKE
jgi:protein-L-isoaspartate(D-aspartate) O-methyltransferase